MLKQCSLPLPPPTEPFEMLAGTVKHCLAGFPSLFRKLLGGSADGMQKSGARFRLQVAEQLRTWLSCPLAEIGQNRSSQLVFSRERRAWRDASSVRPLSTSKADGMREGGGRRRRRRDMEESWRQSSESMEVRRGLGGSGGTIFYVFGTGRSDLEMLRNRARF